MKAMKGMNMNRMLGSLKRKPGNASADGPSSSSTSGLDTPEANAIRSVRLFCESGGPNGSGEEVLYLPTIVESCESSPQAAKDAAHSIRKFLSKDNYHKPYIQYNSIMLIRILADNPGKTFTRNIDEKFVTTIKDLLRNGRDPSVKQILMETLDTFQRQKADDEGLTQLLEMWKKEHEKLVKLHGQAGAQNMAAPYNPHSQNYFSRSHSNRRFPAPHELSSRIEEAKTSAQLLSQTVQSTPPSELLQNDLVREFADRCQSASRSIQSYMIAENPGPDNDTMETLIETNELLVKAMNQHQRAVLSARKAAGIGAGTTTSTPPARTDSGFVAPPPGPPPQSTRPQAPVSRKEAPQIPPPGDYAPNDKEDENPFLDPSERSAQQEPHNPPLPEDKPSNNTGQFNDQLGAEPWHPGFKETPSYINRQDNAANNATLHGAATTPAAGLESSGNRRGRDEEEEDEYGAQLKAKGPVYRY